MCGSVEVGHEHTEFVGVPHSRAKVSEFDVSVPPECVKVYESSFAFLDLPGRLGRACAGHRASHEITANLTFVR